MVGGPKKKESLILQREPFSTVCYRISASLWILSKALKWFSILNEVISNCFQIAPLCSSITDWAYRSSCMTKSWSIIVT